MGRQVQSADFFPPPLPICFLKIYKVYYSLISPIVLWMYYMVCLIKGCVCALL